MEVSNPFPVTTYLGPQYFCDREKEVQLLKTNALNGLHTLILSVRRMGKTGLIQHFFANPGKKSITTIYLDILPTRDLNDLTSELATAIARAYPPSRRPGKMFFEILQRLRPVISFDPLTGNPEITFDFVKEKESSATLSTLLEFLGKQKNRIILAIDEFQQVLQYEEKNVEALIRKNLQQFNNVSFIFSGSSKHLLTDMFSDTRRPFFSSAQPLYLEPIPRKNYSTFIEKQFKAGKRKISPAAVDYILDWTRLHTYYTQVVCNRLYGSGLKVINEEQVREICHKILQEQEYVFYQYRQLLTSNQWEVLEAIGKEGKVRKPGGREFITNYNLGTASHVQRSVGSLLEKQMIYEDKDSEGDFLTVYDTFLSRWLESH